MAKLLRLLPANVRVPRRHSHLRAGQLVLHKDQALLQFKAFRTKRYPGKLCGYSTTKHNVPALRFQIGFYRTYLLSAAFTGSYPHSSILQRQRNLHSPYLTNVLSLKGFGSFSRFSSTGSTGREEEPSGESGADEKSYALALGTRVIILCLYAFVAHTLLVGCFSSPGSNKQQAHPATQSRKS